MVKFDFFNKRTGCFETTSLPNDVFKDVLKFSRLAGISSNVFNVR